MSKYKFFHAIATIFFISVGGTGCAVTSDLDQLIAQERSELSKLSKELKNESPPLFLVTQDVQADLKYRPLNIWLKDISIPQFTISAIGVKAVDDIVYQPNIGKAWLQPAHDTKALLGLSNLELHGNTSGIVWSTNATAKAESRAYFEIFRIQGNVLCDGSLPGTPITGTLVLTGTKGTTLEYSMRIAAPAGLKVGLMCGLGRLGSYGFDIPLGTITNSVSNGTVDLGMSTTGKITLPKEIGGRSISYRLRTIDPSVTTSTDSLTVRENVEVTIE